MTMTDTTDPIAAEADRIRVGLERRVKEIASSPDLTDEARMRQASEAHSNATQSMDDLRARATAERERQQRAAASRLLGSTGNVSGADAISMRDATERAERLESAADARKLLDRARSNGDETLARAILFEARERSQSLLNGAWARLLDEEGRSNSDIAADVRAMGVGHGSSFESALRFMIPSLSDVRWQVGG